MRQITFSMTCELLCHFYNSKYQEWIMVELTWHSVFICQREAFLLFLWDKKYFPSNALPSDEYFSWAFHLSILWNCLIWKYFAISRRILHKNHTQKMCKTIFERLLPNLITYFMSRNILFETWWWFFIQYPPFR